MKQLWILTLAALCGWHAHAQGTFTFSNRALALGLNQPVVHYGTMNGVQGPKFVAAVFLFGVQLGPPAPFRTGAGAGYWDAGADNLRVVQGAFSGDEVRGFTVRVWNSAYGNTYEMARGVDGRAGESTEFAIVLGGPKADPLLPPDLPGAMLNFTNFGIGMPEPSVLGLGALGATLMLAVRRPKQPRAAGCQNESNL